VIYRQFAVTIAVAMGFSLFVALSLSPSLCSLFLKAKDKDKKNKFFGWFNWGYGKLASGHGRLMEYLLRGWRSRFLMPLFFILIVAASIFMFLRIPSSFLPQEDQGRMFVLLNGPASSTIEQTLEKLNKVEDFFLDEVGDAVNGLFTAAGFSFAGSGQNVGIAFVTFKPWDERGEENSVFKIQEKARAALSSIPDAFVIPIVPPPVSALGNSSGFQFQLLDQAGLGNDRLQAAMGQFLGMANQHPNLTGVRFNGLPESPQYKLDIDSVKAKALGVQLPTINQTLAIALGGVYINDFLENGRIKRVYAQADAPYRMLPNDIGQWYVRNMDGNMVPIAEIGAGEWQYGSPKLTRYNGSPALEIQGQGADGVSSGQAMDTVMELVDQLPDGIGLEWTGLSFEERNSGNQAPILYAIAIISVFLILAALYESWAIPIAIMLVVPFGIFGATFSVWLTQEFEFFNSQSNDVYFQIGLLMTIGLAAKNAILIVEFARSNFDSGMRAYDAAVKAAKLRLRPILMTSLTFILGVAPLAFASGPGSGAQNAVAIGVVGGLIATTIFVVFFAPFFFIWVYRLFKVKEVQANRDNDQSDKNDNNYNDDGQGREMPHV
jgi:multidrug efflux pump